jgi:hypothetical protein
LVAISGDEASAATPMASAQRARRLMAGLAATATAILLFLGLLSIAVAATARVDCRDNYLLADNGSRILINDNSGLLISGRQCELNAGPFRMALPSWVNAILR